MQIEVPVSAVEHDEKRSAGMHHLHRAARIMLCWRDHVLWCITTVDETPTQHGRHSSAFVPSLVPPGRPKLHAPSNIATAPLAAPVPSLPL